MNTDIQLLTGEWHDPELLVEAEQVFHAVENRFSRFRPSSELSRLNSCAGREVVVSPEMYDLLSRCVSLYSLSRGLFDPAILPDLEAAGYDCSFELVPHSSPQQWPEIADPRRGSIGDLTIDGQRLTVRAPPRLRLDLGGIGKGFAVDRSAEVLAPSADFLIDAGGDIYASGNGPDGPGWLVAVDSPLQEDEDLALVRLRNQALATSTITRRRWRRAGRWFHHLIDPRTGQPADTDVISVSVIAHTAVEADVFAKVALLLGLDSGREFLRLRNAHGLFVLSGGTFHMTDHWPEGVHE